MARIRSIKPEFFTSLTIGALPPIVRLTFVGLWTYVDDDGRGVDDARLVRAAVCPLDDRTTADVENDLFAIEQAGLIQRYEAGGKKYLAVANWNEHQKVSHPRESRYPAPPNHLQSVPESSGNFPESSGALPPRAGAEQGAGSREQGGTTTVAKATDGEPSEDRTQPTEPATPPTPGPAPRTAGPDAPEPLALSLGRVLDPAPPATNSAEPDATAAEVWALNRGLIAGAIREHAWLHGPAPQVAGRRRKWGMDNELSIAKELLKNHTPEELIGGLQHWRRVHAVPDGQQFTLAFCYAMGERWRMELAIESWRGAQLDAIDLTEYLEARLAS